MFNSFGDKVRIKRSAETEDRGLAGKVGVIYGHTAPSSTSVEVIGKPQDDFAINVHFDDLQTSYWFDASLLEKIDDGQGTVITLDGIDKKWTKGQNGEWFEENTSPTPENTKSWWQFWK